MQKKKGETVKKEIIKKVPAKGKYIEAIGRRKTSTARVRLFEASGSKKGEAGIEVNEKPLEKYFPLGGYCRTVSSPLARLDVLSKFSFTVRVKGGGVSSQAQAIRHGISRTLCEFDETLRGKLKGWGFLKRDPRAVERKKYGLKKARRAPQWSKR